MQNNRVKIIQPTVGFHGNNMVPLRVKKRVCAYVRVSTDKEEQKTSYLAQRDEYESRISKRNEWEFVGIFADEGISGTSTKKRKEFNRMVDYARRGMIDIILTKSISRFARNTVDAINYVRELRRINVEIQFEKENISSLDPKVEFLLTIMSSIAQEEARNTSENIKWTVKRKFKEGIPVVNHKRFLGYTKDKKTKNLVVVPEEAEIVRMIFNLYTTGVGSSEICRIMMKNNYKTGAGKPLWRYSTVKSILTNEKYTGDMLQQKTVCVDFLTHQRVKNDNHEPTYYIENNHEAIISKEMFQLAQSIRKQRAEVRRGNDKNLSKYTRRYPFSAMIICNECGRTLKRRHWNYGTPSQRIMQQCGNYIKGKEKCTAKAVYQEILEGCTLKVLNEFFLSDIDISNELNKIIDSSITTPDFTKKLKELNDDKSTIEESLSNLTNIKLKENNISDSLFNKKFAEYNKRLTKINNEITNIEKDYTEVYDTQNRIILIKELINSTTSKVIELDTDMLRTFIHKIITVSPTEVVFCVLGSKEYTDNEFIKKRHEFVNNTPIASGTYTSLKYNKHMNYRVVII